MREIKFRVWDEQLERFIYFGLFGYPFDDMGEEYVKQNAEQYTGLKDKNGKEIYEGDILQRYKRSGEKYKTTKTVEWGYAGFIKIEFIDECEIIGNIHEE